RRQWLWKHSHSGGRQIYGRRTPRGLDVQEIAFLDEGRHIGDVNTDDNFLASMHDTQGIVDLTRIFIIDSECDDVLKIEARYVAYERPKLLRCFDQLS